MQKISLPFAVPAEAAILIPGAQASRVWLLLGITVLVLGVPCLDSAADEPQKGQSAVATAPTPGDPGRYNVVWDSPSANAGDSMPIGNGDIGLNVWVERSGDLLFYVAKTDACDENSTFVKLGRIRVALTPNPFAAGGPFRQELKLRQGEIAITAGKAGQSVRLRVWVDANRPQVNVEAAGEEPFEMQAKLELWRTRPRMIKMKSQRMDDESFGYFEFRNGPPITIEPDTVLPARANRLTWCHRNERSMYPEVLKVQHLGSLLDKYPDPLLHRTFGCRMDGPDMLAVDDHILRSEHKGAAHRLCITAYTALTPTMEVWQAEIDKLADADEATDLEAARQAHAQWWQDFWARSWIDVVGSKEASSASSRQAEQVASGYALHRWMEACDGRGAIPMKFNGGLFTVGRSFADSGDKSKKVENPDWRAWGSSLWFQNQRHLYWPLIASGDFDLMAPWFKMYVDDLPLVRDKTRLYYHHGGAGFQETIHFWGTANAQDFGWDNKSVDLTDKWIHWYWSGGIEMMAMMLARYHYTDDRAFATDTLVPFARAITTFFNEHWKRDESGKIRFVPAQSLETWQQGVVNPLPEIAGLRYVLPQLLALPEDLTSALDREMWVKLLADLPPIPIGPGKDGQPILLPAEKFKEEPKNSENTELYAVYPYRIYGLGKPDLDLARRTFAQRRFPAATCWAWDPMCAAMLGLTDEAAKDVTANFTATGARFQAFWKPGHDWIPDFDNGGAGMQTLQWMLMQCDGKRIVLLPAWPKDWNADFKLRAPHQTTVEGTVRDGKVVTLRVTPEERRKDVIIGVEGLESPSPNGVK